MLLVFCHLILFVSSTNYFQIVRRQCCLCMALSRVRSKQSVDDSLSLTKFKILIISPFVSQAFSHFMMKPVNLLNMRHQRCIFSQRVLSIAGALVILVTHNSLRGVIPSHHIHTKVLNVFCGGATLHPKWTFYQSPEMLNV